MIYYFQRFIFFEIRLCATVNTLIVCNKKQTSLRFLDHTISVLGAVLGRIYFNPISWTIKSEI